jgi:hypothetical protein
MSMTEPHRDPPFQHPTDDDLQTAHREADARHVEVCLAEPADDRASVVAWMVRCGEAAAARWDYLNDIAEENANRLTNDDL